VAVVRALLAQGCGKRMWRHTPSQFERCCNQLLAIELTDRGWLHSIGIEPVVLCLVRPSAMGKVQ
jgi:hypothetical protein